MSNKTTTSEPIKKTFRFDEIDQENFAKIVEHFDVATESKAMTMLLGHYMKKVKDLKDTKAALTVAEARLREAHDLIRRASDISYELNEHAKRKY